MDEELPEEMTNRGGARGLRDGSAPMETGKLPGKRPGIGVAQVARAAGLNRLRLPCGFRVAAAPSDLVSGQWRGSSYAARPINGPWAGHSRARCADLVVEGISSGEGSRARAGGRLLRSEGVTALRYASAQVSGPQPTSPAGLQAMSTLLGARTNFTSLSMR